jgi:hypothetical protein
MRPCIRRSRCPGFGSNLLEKKASKTCPDTLCADPEAYQAGKNAGQSAMIANVGIGVGLAGVGVGLVLVLTSGKPAPKPSTARLVPWVGREGGGASWQASW